MSAHYPAHAWGGIQVDAYINGAAPSSTLAPTGAVAVGGAWDEAEVLDERFCQSISMKTEKQCRAYPKKGSAHCIYHSPRVSADDGANS